MPLSDFFMASLLLPAGQTLSAECQAIMTAAGDECQETQDIESGDVVCNLLMFRSSGNPFVAIPSLRRGAKVERRKVQSVEELEKQLEEAIRAGRLFPVSEENFKRGPVEALSEALESRGTVQDPLGNCSDQQRAQRAARLLDPEAMVAEGDGAVFRPFRFPTRMSEAFKLPWADIGKVKEAQLQNFYRGSNMPSTPPRVVGAIIYLHHHYLVPFKQRVISKGRHLLVISINEGAGRNKRRCLAWWMPLAEVRERFADPRQADLYSHGGSVHRVCHMVETYSLNKTVPIHFAYGVRPNLIVGGVPLNCYDVAPEFKTPWRLNSTAEELEEERQKVAECLELRMPLEKSLEARKADKRRRKRQNRKTRDRERAAEDAQASRQAAAAEVEKEAEERRQKLVHPNAALHESGFLDSLLDDMRQRRAARLAEKAAAGNASVRPQHCESPAVEPCNDEALFFAGDSGAALHQLSAREDSEVFSAGESSSEQSE